MSSDIQLDDTTWRIRLFGSLEIVTPAGNVIAVPGKKTGELLAYLALHPNRAHSREKLIDLIWGDSEVADGGARLRQELTKLRAILSASPPGCELVLITRDECRLQPDVIVDALTLQGACLEGQRETDLHLQKRLYEKAIGYYKADLLAGYDAPWIAAERLRLSQCYSRALLNLAETKRQLQDYTGAEQALNRLLVHDPLMEECYVALMRLSADMGQPTRVQQHCEALERALREGLGIEPADESRQLAKTLREQARRRGLTMPETEAVSTLSIQEAIPIARSPGETAIADLTRDAGSSSAAPQDRTSRNTLRRAPVGTFAFLFVVAAVSMGYLRSKELKNVSGRRAAAVVARNQEKWAYYYEPRPGEKPNAEGRAVVTDKSGVYVTGMIQTDKDDTDILTLRLSVVGKLLWADRYGSPEHDCDRAFSVCADGNGGIYVAGETYVPAHFTDSEGWHLTLLHYDSNGQRVWVRRSPMVVHTEGENIQVCSDMHGGCYLGGTGLTVGTESALVLRYDMFGKLLWHQSIREGSRTIFSRIAVSPASEVYLCGTARMGQGPAGVNDDWLVARIDPDGQSKWRQFVNGTAHGANSAARIAMVADGGVVVAGAVDSLSGGPTGGSGLQMAVYKYSSTGDIVWHKVVTESGPTVVVDGLSTNVLGDMEIGGTERRPDGYWDILTARYDPNGNRTSLARQPALAGYQSASMCGATLFPNERTALVGQTCDGPGSSMVEESAVFVTECAPNGNALRHLLFNLAPHTKNIVRDYLVDGDVVLTGQTGPTNGPRALMVLHY